MTRLLLALIGVVLLAVVALGALWLAGQMLLGAGLLLSGAAGVLLKLLWFLGVAGVLGGLMYFVTSAWRPGERLGGALPAPVPAAAVPVQAPRRWRRSKTVIAAQPAVTSAPLTSGPPVAEAPQASVLSEAAVVSETHQEPSSDHPAGAAPSGEPERPTPQ